MMRTKYKSIFRGAGSIDLRAYAEALSMLEQAGFKGIWGHKIMVDAELSRRRERELGEYQKGGTR